MTFISYQSFDDDDDDDDDDDTFLDITTGTTYLLHYRTY